MDEQTATMDEERFEDGGQPPQRRPRWYEQPVARDPDHHVVGGVIAGTATAYGFDVRTSRIAVAIATIVLPVLVLVYLAAWVVLPRGPDDAASLEAIMRDRRRLPLYIAIGVVLVAGGVGSLGSWFLFGDVPWGLGLIAVGVLLWVTPAIAARRDASTGWAPPAQPVDGSIPATPSRLGTTALDGTPLVAPAMPTRPPRRPRRPVGAVAVVVAFAFAGASALGDALDWWDISLLTGAIWVLGIVAVGAGMSMLVNRSWLPVPALVAAALSMSFLLVAQPRLEGGTGTRRVEPTTIDQLDAPIVLGIGELTVDLTRLDVDLAGAALDVEVGIGRLHLVLPDDATVRLVTELGAGELRIDGVTRAEGIRHDDTRTLAPTDGSTEVGSGVATPGSPFEIRVRVGVGQIDIDRVSR